MHVPRGKHGLACLVATADRGVTRLTNVSHRAPARLLPMRGALAEAAGAATCALGSYGGGLLGGDHIALDLKVDVGATLMLSTQASTKVYRTKEDGLPARQTLDASVGDGGLLVVAPDPLVPFAQSSYEGVQRFALHPGGSLVAIDWIGAGRTTIGERWAFTSYASRSEIHMAGKESEEAGASRLRQPAVVEALSLGPRCHEQRAAAFDIGGSTRDVAASVLVVGPRAAGVAERLHAAAAMLTQRRTTASGAPRSGPPSVLTDAALAAASGGDGDAGLPPSALLGDIVLGVSSVELPAVGPEQPGSERRRASTDRTTSAHSDAVQRGGDGGGEAGEGAAVVTVARLVAQHNEDVYRLLHHCLAPLGVATGVRPYADRIHSTSAAAPPPPRPRPRRDELPVLFPPTAAHADAHATTHATGRSDQLLRLIHLCDATLPTGGFAHSGGLEAALQLGLLGSTQAPTLVLHLRHLALAAVHSATQQQAPYALAAHAAVADAMPRLAGVQPGAQPGVLGMPAIEAAERELAATLRALHAEQHALLNANTPGCRASLQVGNALARIASSWIGGGRLAPGDAAATPDAEAAARAARLLSQKGGTPTHGAPTLGALAALLQLPASAVLDAFMYTTARDFFSAAVRLNLIGPLAAVSVQDKVVREVAAASSGVMDLSCAQAAGSAPLVEAAQACHDLLERRIFQT